MSASEEIAVLARAILHLAKEVATTWDYDGESRVSKGVTLDFDIEKRLQELADATPAPLSVCIPVGHVWAESCPTYADGRP